MVCVVDEVGRGELSTLKATVVIGEDAGRLGEALGSPGETRGGLV